MKNTVVFTGGNTGGHVIPSIPVLQLFIVNGWNVVYIGTEKGVEKRVCDSLNIRFRAIRAGKWRRYRDLRNLTDIVWTAIGIFQSIYILLRERPRIVFAKGGFVSVPVIIAASLLHIRCFVHESDASPSLTTRIALMMGKRVLCGSRKCQRHIGSEKAAYVGIPVRREIFHGSRDTGLSMASFEGNKPFLLICFGSTGATRLASRIREVIPALCDRFNVLHIVGRGNKSLSAPLKDYLEIEECFVGFEHLLAAADIILSRAGATALAELALVKKPVILVPLGKLASRGEQLENAAEFVGEHGGAVLSEEQFQGELIVRTVHQVYNSHLPQSVQSKHERLPEEIIFEALTQDES